MTVAMLEMAQSSETVGRFFKAAEPKRGGSLDGCHVQEIQCDVASMRARASYYVMMMIMMMIKCLT
jgi:hypothetical protein